MKKHVFCRFVRLFLLLICSFAIQIPSGIGEQIVHSNIRVYLRRLQVKDTLQIQVTGSYMLEDGSLLFSDGANATIALRDDELVLHMDQISIKMGDTIHLIRCASDVSSGLTLNESGLYEGDLCLDIHAGVIRPILHIDVEDYLLGVVPFEMGDSFPLEALKAQAIAARTYALRKSGANNDYDVEDTTNDQAYRGRTTNSPLSEQAVMETEGLCGVYQGRLAECYYSASNGGQTELGQNIWPLDDPDAYGYMDMQDDPYDYSNPASSVRRFTLSKKPEESDINPVLKEAFAIALENDLENLGFQSSPDLIRIDEILSLEAITPKFSGTSRLMTELCFSIKLSMRERLYDNSAAEISEVTAQSTPEPTYTAFAKVDHTFHITIPYFSEVERAMGLSINISENELITVFDIGSAFMIESRRYGHGVGMSQRGAEQMARHHGMTYEQILAFYYPRMEIVSYSAERKPLNTPNPILAATPAPTPSPTPRPTLMPVSVENVPKDGYIAFVTNIEDDSSLNLRQAPSYSSEILRRLFKYQELIVITTTPDGWVHVKTDVIEGYVRNEYLQAKEKP